MTDTTAAAPQSTLISILNEAVKIGSTAIQFGKDAAPVAQLIYDTFIKSGAAGTAGLDLASMIPVLGSVFQVGSAVLKVGMDLAPVATMLYDTFILKKTMTQDELDAFAAETDRIGELLMAPLPDPEPGEAV